jgi:ATP-dependent RNA helicase DHX57
VPGLYSQSFGPAQNFISPTAFREITSLRLDFHYSLCDLGFIPLSSRPDSPAINTHSDNTNLLKAIILGGLWPRVARAHLPKSAIKFDKVQAGTVQRENTAKEFKIYDLREGRVFLHPASVLFGATAWRSPFLVYFNKHMTSKIFLRDATEVHSTQEGSWVADRLQWTTGPSVRSSLIRWSCFSEPYCWWGDNP